MSVHSDFHETLTMVERRVIDALMKFRDASGFNNKHKATTLRSVAATARLLAVAADEFAAFLEKSDV